MFFQCEGSDLLTCPLFDKAAKCNLLAISDWISKNSGYLESGKINQFTPLSLETHVISGFTKSVTIKPYNTLLSDDVKIIQCEDSHIYIDHPIKTLSIT